MGGAIDPGLFRTELSLQQATVAGDGHGGHTESWAELAKVLCRVEPLAARSAYQADQTIETVTHRITLRARTDLSAGMRFVSDTRVFEVLTVHDPDETGRYVVCSAREQKP
jgi:SPP1 family predicted phage head-tail adaptor